MTQDCRCATARHHPTCPVSLELARDILRRALTVVSAYLWDNRQTFAGMDARYLEVTAEARAALAQADDR